MRLIHLTDLHLTSLSDQSFWRLRGKRRLGYLSWRRRRSRIHRPEVLAELIAAVAAERADQILISGDLVQLGLAAEIERALDCLRQLGPPEAVTLVPGNHDLYGAESWDAVRAHWGAYLHLPAAGPDPSTGYPIRRRLGPVDLIGLSSACPTSALLASGRLGPGQLERLSKGLRPERGGLRCLLVHHPPLPGVVSRRKALSDAAALAAIIRSAPVHLALHGHVHRNCEHRLGPGIVYGTASASSASESAPAAYRRFDVAESAGGWRVRMALRSLTPDRGLVTMADAELEFSAPETD